jgi:shikimate dehydrogenase
MSDLFDFKSRPTAFAVIGNPVRHSRSPQIHKLFAEQCGVVLEYERIQVDIGGFEQAVSHFHANGGAGLNVTVPFKRDAWQLCRRGANSLSARADQAEAVNTLKFEADGSVLGDNTDGMGLVSDIEKNLGFSIRGASVLLVGAGGAISGIIGPILQSSPGEITIANRTRVKSDYLARRYGNGIKTMELEQVPETPFDLIINGTAASLDGKLPGIDTACICDNSLVYDMMYQLQPTAFMKWALDNGSARASDGLGMLVEQAVGSFYIWHGKRPDSEVVIQALRKI